MKSTESLTRELFSLDEPWRSRFLARIANRATKYTWDNQIPDFDEVATWLSTPAIYREAKLLLRIWQGG